MSLGISVCVLLGALNLFATLFLAFRIDWAALSQSRNRGFSVAPEMADFSKAITEMMVQMFPLLKKTDVEQGSPDTARLDFLERLSSPHFNGDYEGPGVRLSVFQGNRNDMYPRTIAESDTIRGCIDQAMKSPVAKKEVPS